MTRSGKAVLVFGLLLFWGLAVWLVFRSVAPTPGEKYEEWLAARRHGGVAGSRLEMWANRFGITYFANARRERDRRLTGELPVEADYAVAVASWRDSTGGIAPGLQPTWPHVRKSLEEMTGGADAERLEAALVRADAAGFATWELTIARSAHRSGALDELAPIVRTLREFEQAHQPGSHRMASLQRIYELYALTPAGFARALVEETDPGAEALLYLVMGDLGVPPERAHGALVSEWKTGGFPEADWGMPARILKDARVGSFRLGVFTWLALGRESEEWRKHHRATIGDLLEEFRRTEPAFAKECASSLVREITKEGSKLASDWNFVAGILLSKIDPEPDLESWIGNEVGSDFVWLCHSVNAEGLLNRALEIWGDQVPHRSFWIGHFIDAGHYAAVCALIEGAKGDLHSIRSQKETYQEEKAKKLDEYLALGERIREHSNEDQVKGFIRLELGITAMRNLHRTPEEDAAKREVLAAIEMLNEAETFNPYLLERTVALVVEMTDEFFAAARPCFDKWRGAVTPEMVVDRVVRGDFDRDESGYEVWSKYFRNFVTMSELPSLEGTVVGLIRSLPQDETAGHGLDRLEEFLGVGRGNSKPAGTYLGVWVGRRFIEARRWEDAVGWMFDRIEDHHARNPDVDMVRLVHEIYEEMNRGLGEENVADHLDWLGAVLADKRSELYSWPATFAFFYRDIAADPAEIIDGCHIRFGQHPLRRWILRNLLNDRFPNLDKRPEQLSGILELTEHSWVREVIKESFDKTFDLDAFERDFETASPGARRFFLRNPVVYWRNRRPPRHPDGRDFTKEEVARLLVWEARQAIEIMERREYFESHEFVRIFTDLIAEAETRPDDPAALRKIAGHCFRSAVAGPR